MDNVDDIVRQAVGLRASDVHVAPGVPCATA